MKPVVEAGFETRVARIDTIAEGIRYIELERADGGLLPDFEPGAHIDLHLGGSMARQYSLCNGPDAKSRYQIAVKREEVSRGGSTAIHDRLQVGDVVRVTGPRNHFSLADEATRHLLVAGGIGVTPLLSMARHLKARDQVFQLDYFSRSDRHTAFQQELRRTDWAGRVNLHHGVEPDQLPARFEELFSRCCGGTHVYVCGPRPFMDLALATAARYLDKGRLHCEYFVGDPAPAKAARRSFTVFCARSDKQFEVAKDERLVNALSRHGVQVDVMCEQGVCGTCATAVIQGRPDHRDSYLTEDERDEGKTIMVCCSRSLDPLLVLDL